MQMLNSRNQLSVPLAPPPPPFRINFKNNPVMQNKCNTLQTKSFTIDECIWANAFPELQKACYLNKVCIDSPPKSCQYKNISSILQEGPTCGLTALSMLLGGTPAAAELVIRAKAENFTYNGEMFSTKNLFKLVCDTGANKTEADGSAFECLIYEGQLNCAKVRDFLLDGACIFIAYDPDFNNTPSLKNGHKAHWALVIGFLIDETDEFYVIARHGKTKNLAVWSLKSLSDSNSNLEEFSQPVGYPNCDFLLPKDGIGGKLGLKEQAIIVNKLNKETIIVK